MRLPAEKIRECPHHGHYAASKCPHCPRTCIHGIESPDGRCSLACMGRPIAAPTVPTSAFLPPEQGKVAETRKGTEKQLQEQIEAFLRRSGVNWPVRSRMDRATTVRVGTPDFLFVYRGIPIAWEIKLPGKHPTEDQVHAMELLRRDGWRVAVIRSYDEAREALETQTQ